MSTDPKAGPTTLKTGLPAEQHNGLFGAEHKIMHLGVTGRFTATVTFEVADIVTSEAKDTTRPVVELVAIEPHWAAEDIDAAKVLQESAYKARTGANQLDFDSIGVKPEPEKKSKVVEK